MHWLALLGIGGVGFWAAKKYLGGDGNAEARTHMPKHIPPTKPPENPYKPAGFTPPVPRGQTGPKGASDMLQPYAMNLNASAAQQAIVDAVGRGECEFSFSSIESEHDGHTAVFMVFTDALKLDGLRVPVTAITQQRVADLLDCMPITTKVADLIWAQKTRKALPIPMGIERMQELSTVKAYNAKVDLALATGNAEPSGLACNVGKLWVLDNILERKRNVGVNYGWFYGTAPGFQGTSGERTASGLTEGDKPVRLIQGAGTHHDDKYTDYSQVCVLMYNTCYVDGVARKTSEVLSDPELAGLGNVGGVLRVLRQPGAPVLVQPGSGKVGS
jgi:hypothetical protein